MRRLVRNLRRVVVVASLVGVAYVMLRFEFTTAPPAVFGPRSGDAAEAPRILVDLRPRPLVPGDLVVFSDVNGARRMGEVQRADPTELSLVAPGAPTGGQSVDVPRELLRGRVLMTFEDGP